ncbi:MAG: TIGR01212 family radical SAM protein [Erysipelotrichales bacterium]
MNDFIYSNDNKRYHTFNYYLKNKYDSKVFKVSLNADFSCPNRDGKVAYGGCSFCSALGSGDFAGNRVDNLNKQFDDIKEKMHHKWQDGKYIAYFQAYTNTYAPLNILKETFQPFINKEGVVALSIATRPDSLEDDVIEYLGSLTNKVDIWIELGLQTTYDATATSFNRGYNYDVFLDTIKRLEKTNIKVCIHMINGFMNETKEMMIENIRRISHLPIDGIKIHMLHLIKGTKMANEYLANDSELLSLEEYVEIVVKQLELLPPTMIIQRLTGDANKDELLAQEWTLNKTNVLNSIDKYMAKNNVLQGDKYE